MPPFVRSPAHARRHTASCVGLALLAALAVPSQVLATDWFVTAGTARYEKCGGAGCWQQPPLPSEWRLKTGTFGVGLRAGAWEVGLHHFGRVSVHGFYVPDTDYSPKTQAIREGARNWRGLAQQETYGLALRMAPSWQAGSFTLLTKLGVLAYQQRLKIAIDWIDGDCCSTHFEIVESKLTPMVGLELTYPITASLRAGVAVDAAWRVRTTDSPAGGGDSNRPGLLTYALVVRSTF